VGDCLSSNTLLFRSRKDGKGGLGEIRKVSSSNGVCGLGIIGEYHHLLQACTVLIKTHLP
jgi:hypothetical protein